MVNRIASKAHLLCLISGLSLWTASCQTPTPLPDTADFPEAVVVQHTPALRNIAPVLEACADEDPDLALFLEEVPKTAIMLDRQEESLTRLAIALGETPAKLFAAALGEVQLAIIVHPSNPIEKLSASELRELFTGQIQNWTELGGTDQRVTPWVLTPADESRQLFETIILAGEKVYGQARLAADPTWMLAGIAEDPGAIGYLPSTWLERSVKAISTEPGLAEELRLPLLALAKSEPDGAARRLLICLQTGNGQERLNELYQTP